VSVRAWSVAAGGALALAALGIGCSHDPASDAPRADAGASDDAVVSALPQTCMRGARSTAVPATCNGAAELCARTYDKATTPMTHNAMSNADDGFNSPNQSHTLARQLADGVRGMMLDLHYYDVETNENALDHLEGKTAVDQVYLCHTSCALGHTRLLDQLCAITSFLDQNPGEIFSVIFENDVKDADTDEVLRASGLADYAYVHAKGAPWPTLRELIDSNKRVVVFLEQGGGTPAYLHRAYADEMWDTPYSFAKKEDFSCALGRGSKSNALFLVNHWLSNPFGDIGFARDVNTTAVLGGRVTQCASEAGRAPTFVSVDFYDVGDLFGVVRRANGL
jgi:hypothetical protein